MRICGNDGSEIFAAPHVPGDKKIFCQEGELFFPPWPERWAIGTIMQRWLWRPLAMEG